MPENQGPSHAHIPTCLLHDQESPSPCPLSKATVSLSVAEAEATSDFTNRGLGTWRIAKGCCPIDSVHFCSLPTLRSDHRSPVKNLCNQLLHCGHFILLYKINRCQTWSVLSGYFYLNGNINTKYFKRQVTIQELDSLSVIQHIPWLYDPL